MFSTSVVASAKDNYQLRFYNIACVIFFFVIAESHQALTEVLAMKMRKIRIIMLTMLGMKRLVFRSHIRYSQDVRKDASYYVYCHDKKTQ